MNTQQQEVTATNTEIEPASIRLASDFYNSPTAIAGAASAAAIAARFTTMSADNAPSRTSAAAAVGNPGNKFSVSEQKQLEPEYSDDSALNLLDLSQLEGAVVAIEVSSETAYQCNPWCLSPSLEYSRVLQLQHVSLSCRMCATSFVWCACTLHDAVDCACTVLDHLSTGGFKPSPHRMQNAFKDVTHGLYSDRQMPRQQVESKYSNSRSKHAALLQEHTGGRYSPAIPPADTFWPCTFNLSKVIMGKLLHVNQ